MGFVIKETFRVAAPVDRVWRYLVDPQQVVQCLPGAELTSDEGERTYGGKVKVKVGPVTAQYAGRAKLTEISEAERVVRMHAEGREAGGAGSAKLRMTTRVEAHADGGSEVRVEADVDVAGKIVQFGRGMIEAVSKQLFRDFVSCVRATLEGASGQVDAQPVQAPANRASADRQDAPPPQVDVQKLESRARSAKPVSVVPLVARAVWATLVSWVARLFGRQRAA